MNKKNELEEKLQQAYWEWRTSYESPGFDLRESINRFVLVLRNYQEELSAKGHKWK